MTKYVIFCQDSALAVASNLADAEEYLLTCVEECAYEDYAYSGFDNTYVEDLISAFVRDRYYETLWGFILGRIGFDFYIDEVEEI